LDEQVKDVTTGKTIDRFPIKINPLKGTCRKHTTVLFGLTIDSIRLGALPIKIIPNTNKEKDRAHAKEVAQKVSDIFTANNAMSLFIENGIKSQYLGGCIFAVRWRPDLQKIELTAPGASEFIAIPDGTNYFSLKEAWIVREITATEARSYNSDFTDESQKYYYVEHWTRTTYKITVNDVVILYNGEAMEGENPFGVVPMVYIPHIRDDGFYGSSLVTDAVKGIIKEMNLRWADLGDAISDDAHEILAVRNVQNGIKPILLGDGRTVLDLGSSNSLVPGGDDKPDLVAIKTQSASVPMITFGQILDGLYRREVDHPSVADGEDQGSQRSSLTLTTRMWPLVSHVEMERMFWTTGLKTLISIMLKFMAVKKIDGIKENDAKIEFTIEWPPMLQRDREVLVNEVAIRGKNKIGSIKHLMGLFDDIEDPELEWKRILEETEQVAEIAKEMKEALGSEADGRVNKDNESDPNNPKGNNQTGGADPEED
jgi:hypothetical protein